MQKQPVLLFVVGSRPQMFQPAGKAFLNHAKGLLQKTSWPTWAILKEPGTLHGMERFKRSTARHCARTKRFTIKVRSVSVEFGNWAKIKHGPVTGGHTPIAKIVLLEVEICLWGRYPKIHHQERTNNLKAVTNICVQVTKTFRCWSQRYMANVYESAW